MLDVYKITSVLEKLPDAALQQYAAMHKQDPYVLSLAVEESNRRKRLRAAPQGEPQGQPAPVNEQAVQGMVPEDTGIAQLPAGNMDFADGGIVAFADGGAADEGIYRYLPEFLRRRIAENAEIAQGGRTVPAPEPTPTSELPGILDALGYGYQRARSGLGDFLQRRVEQHAQDVSDVNIPGPPSRYAGMPAPAAPGAAPTTTSAVLEAARTAPQTPPAGIAAIPSGGGRTSASVSGGVSSAFDPIAYQKRAMKELAVEDPAAAQVEEYGREQRRLAAEREAAYKEALPKGKAYEGLEGQLKKEEEGVASKKEETLKMALINAGLGMMAGTSQFAAVNIGEGAKQGMKTYSEGIKDLEKAAEKRRELATKIEEARRAEAEGRARDAYKLSQDAAGVDAQVRQLQIDGTRKATGLSMEASAKVTEIASALERQRMVAAASLQAARESSSSQAQTAAKTALMEYGRSLRMRYQELEKERRDPMVKFDEPTKVALDSQRMQIMREITSVERQLAVMGGLTPPAPEAAQPAPGNRPPLTSFQK